jgi:hypothetical protein
MDGDVCKLPLKISLKSRTKESGFLPLNFEQLIVLMLQLNGDFSKISFISLQIIDFPESFVPVKFKI